MENLITKPAAWGGMTLTIIVVVILSVFHAEWWNFIPMFFLFMEAFCELMTCYIGSLSTAAAKTLGKCAMIFGIMSLIAMIGIYVVWQIIL